MNAEQFWSHFENADPAKCWMWKNGSSDYHGYGRLYFAGKMHSAHRLSWTLTNGDIPTGLHVLHKCDNPGCCNPRHLFLGTHAANMADRQSKGREARGERHVSRTRPDAVPRGEHVGTSKLGPDDVRAILGLHDVGAMRKDIAELFGIAGKSVERIVYGVTWKHIYEERSR
jgi:hypothetical protein